MFFLRYVAKPNNAIEATRHGGAYVNCWMDLPSIHEAKVIALRMIQEQGYSVCELDEEGEAFREHLEGEALECFEQAETDKTVLVFHCWPPDNPDVENTER
jgi:hypothetical protein